VKGKFFFGQKLCTKKTQTGGASDCGKKSWNKKGQQTDRSSEPGSIQTTRRAADANHQKEFRFEQFRKRGWLFHGGRQIKAQEGSQIGETSQKKSGLGKKKKLKHRNQGPTPGGNRSEPIKSELCNPVEAGNAGKGCPGGPKKQQKSHKSKKMNMTPRDLGELGRKAGGGKGKKTSTRGERRSKATLQKTATREGGGELFGTGIRKTRGENLIKDAKIQKRQGVGWVRRLHRR